MPAPPPVRGPESDGGSVFDKLIEDYDALAERAEDMVFQHVCGEIEMELRAHFFRYVRTFSRVRDVPFSFNAELCPFCFPPLYHAVVTTGDNQIVIHRGNSKNPRSDLTTTMKLRSPRPSWPRSHFSPPISPISNPASRPGCCRIFIGRPPRGFRMEFCTR